LTILVDSSFILRSFLAEQAKGEELYPFKFDTRFINYYPIAK